MTLAFLNIGTQEMILIVIVILLLFGGKKLPELARGLGRGIREFKDASDGIKREISDQINNFEKDMDVTVDEKADAKQKAEPAKVDQKEEVSKEETEQSETSENTKEKSFPNFSTPENTHQHNPGWHPADESEYYKYGYNDHFAEESKEDTTKVDEVEKVEKKTTDKDPS